MTNMNDLPAEIILIILSLLTEEELREDNCAILRVCKSFNQLGTVVLSRSIRITSGNVNGFVARPLESREAHLENAREICFDLTGWNRCCSEKIMRRPFVSGPSNYVNFNEWRQKLNEALRRTNKSLVSCPKLHSVSIKSRSGPPRTCPLIMGDPAYIHPRTLTSLITQLPFVRNLTTLTIDTSNNECSDWSPLNGIGFDCATHVCPLISAVVTARPTLKHLRVRRREVCPALLRFAFNNTAGAEHLETFILSLRLFESQQTSTDTAQTLARHCRCMCRCAQCAHIDPPNYPLPAPFPVYEQLREVIPVALPQMKRIKVFRILSFLRPQKPMLNCARLPFVYDCLTRKTMVAVDWSARTRMDWEDAECEPGWEGWEVFAPEDDPTGHTLKGQSSCFLQQAFSEAQV